jgi:hypothetical protein
MTLRFGTNPIAWSNDDMPALGGATPLETCLSEARAAGYAGIELGNKFPREASVLRPILARHGLALVSGWWSGRLLERSGYRFAGGWFPSPRAARGPEATNATPLAKVRIPTAA